jgi:hypothetical protein
LEPVLECDLSDREGYALLATINHSIDWAVPASALPRANNRMDPSMTGRRPKMFARLPVKGARAEEASV